MPLSPLTLHVPSVVEVSNFFGQPRQFLSACRRGQSHCPANDNETLTEARFEQGLIRVRPTGRNLLCLFVPSRGKSVNPFIVSRLTALGGGRCNRPAYENKTLADARIKKGINRIRLTG